MLTIADKGGGGSENSRNWLADILCGQPLKNRGWCQKIQAGLVCTRLKRAPAVDEGFKEGRVNGGHLG